MIMSWYGFSQSLTLSPIRFQLMPNRMIARVIGKNTHQY